MRVGDPLRKAFGFVRSQFAPQGLPLAIAAIWFALGLAVVLWIWGLDPLVFQSPDEAVVRYAASLIRKRQGPFLSLPFADPEDLLHPRSWISIGNRATPTYAPVSFYVYGWLTRLRGGVGLFLIAALPASALGAFAAGTARLLPPSRRRWLAILAPVMPFPTVYWLLHPWINASPMLIGLCWSVFCWATWRESGRTSWLAATLLCLGYAAAVRPDLAAYLFAVALLLSVAASPKQWRLIAGLVCGSGVLALSVNLILNWVITGHPLTAAYQMQIDRQWGPEPAHTLPGLGMLRSLLLPMGIPAWSIGSEAFLKYWLKMGPIAALLVGQLLLVPLLMKGSRLARALNVGAVLLIVIFMISRMHDGVFGTHTSLGEVHHSVPRYLAPVYLMAALPPLLFVGRSSKGWVVAVGSVLIFALSASGCYEIAVRGQGSLRFVHRFVHDKQAALVQLRRFIPAGATVYTEKEDKWIWSGWRVWMVGEPEATAVSIERALAANVELFVVEPKRTALFKQLRATLRRRRISLVRIDAWRGVYRVDPPAPPEPEPVLVPEPEPLPQRAPEPLPEP